MSNWSLVPGSPESRAYDEIDITIQVGARGTANLARAEGLRAVLRVDLDVGRNAGPVNVQASAVIDVFEMAPSGRAVLAAAADAESGLVAVIEDETAAGQKVARPGECRAAGEQ
jgi:hypothetical protein